MSPKKNMQTVCFLFFIVLEFHTFRVLNSKASSGLERAQRTRINVT